MKHEKDLGTVTVSQKAAMQTVEYITKNTDGIVRMAEKSRRGDITRIFLGSGGTKGVYFNKTEDGFMIEIYVICRYGINAGEVCKKISSEVRSELQENMGIPVSRVIVRVEGVDVPERR